MHAGEKKTFQRTTQNAMERKLCIPYKDRMEVNGYICWGKWFIVTLASESSGKNLDAIKNVKSVCFAQIKSNSSRNLFKYYP